MQTLSRISLSAIVLGLLGTLPLVVGCDRDQAPPPLPSAAPPPTTPVPALALEEEEDAGTEEPTGTGTGRPRSSLAACCSALAQNAKSAPEPTAGFMRAAAGICQGASASGQDRASAAAAIQAALRGAGMPAACN